MNWDDVMVFRVTAEELSFTKAAHRLGMSVSAVSQRVRRLERRTGLQLLQRTTAKVALTSDGQAVMAAATKIEDVWQTTMADLAREHEHPTATEQPVRVGFLRAGHRNPLWSQIKAVAPDRIWEPRHYASTASGFAELRRGNLEFYLWSTWTTPNKPVDVDLNGLGSVDIARDDVVVALNENHALAALPCVPFADLAECEWVAPSSAEDQALTVSICAELGNFRPRFTHELDGYAEVMAAISDTNAIDLCSPSSPPYLGVVMRSLKPAPTTRYALSWRRNPDVDRLAPRVVAAVRRRYAEKTKAWNPRHWEHVKANSDAYPGIVESSSPDREPGSTA